MAARVAGCLLVAGMATLVVLMLVASPDKAAAGGPVFGVMLAAYLAAYLYGRPRLAAVAIGASLLPALAVTRLDPSETLRGE